MYTRTSFSACVLSCAIFGLIFLPGGAPSPASEDPATMKPKPAGTNPFKDEVQKQLDTQFGELLAFYKHMHAAPELSLQEVKTSGRLAEELKKLGFEVTQKVGGTGVVGIFANGKGPTVLVRTDMDALSVIEQTDLPYASKQRVRDRNGNEVGVMHACGHDMHMTCWLGAARTLVTLKDRWKGTLVFIGQPAEEVGSGARQMLDDGLFKRFPKPDYCLALHCNASLPHGTIGYCDGMVLANVDSVDVTVRGKGGHGAWPHTTVDPIVLASKIVLDLQTLVSRETNPLDPAVVTVGSFHGGTKHNIIPDEVKLQLTVRSTKDSVRKNLLDGIKRICEANALAAKAPPPTVTVDPNEFTPALYNDPALTKKTVSLFKDALGAENVIERAPSMGGEDFSRYGRAGVPILMFWLGTVAPERVAEAAKEGGKPLPSLHSDRYAPVPEPSIRTGVTAMSLAVLQLMGKP
jgi:amidohydrolase